MNENYLPICTCCYAVRVEPHRAKTPRPTCMDCGETLARMVQHTVAPINKSSYMHISNTEELKQLNPKRTPV
jgi:transposase-like protein